MASPVLIHIPHASPAISKEDFNDFLPSGGEMRHELIRLTDWYTDELFGGDWAPQNVLQFQHSRLVVDVERFASDDEEPCAKVGMGATYVKTTRGEPLRRLSTSRREELIRKYYEPHHQIFTEKVIQILEKFSRCVIIDGHSYPTEPLPTQTNYMSTPEIGIGTDDSFTSPELIELTENYFKSHGLDVGLNQPFHGTIIPAQIYKSKDSRVQSVMIEVRRDLYIDENTAEKNGQFETIKKLIDDYRRLVSDHFLTV
jgi:N-formylglutamate amidohydrolase